MPVDLGHRCIFGMAVIREMREDPAGDLPGRATSSGAYGMVDVAPWQYGCRTNLGLSVCRARVRRTRTMSVTTLEGVVENGRIRLVEPARLPERATVYVVIPGEERRRRAYARSPRLVHREQAGDFEKQVFEDE